MEDIITDYVTGKSTPNVGPEGNRQLFEKILVETKGFSKKEIRVDEPITVTFQTQLYHSTLDLVVFCEDRPFMAVKCIAGSLGSYEREVLSGARLVYDHQIPFSVTTNGKDALVRNVITGKLHGEEMDTVPTRQWAKEQIETMEKVLFPENKREREMILFRSYNIEKEEHECDQ